MFECILNTTNNYELIKAWGPVIIGILSVISALIVNWRLLKSKSKEEERNEINKKLNEFYGPFIQLRKKSTMLYRVFTQGKEEHYKTLTAILNGDKFSDNDISLLNQIISINKQLEDLIVSKSGYVEDIELRNLLGEAATHFNIMFLAHERLIKGEMEKFEKYLFPRVLDEKIELEIEKLNKRLKELK